MSVVDKFMAALVKAAAPAKKKKRKPASGKTKAKAAKKPKAATGTGKKTKKKTANNPKKPKLTRLANGMVHQGYAEPTSVMAIGPGTISRIAVNGKVLATNLTFQHKYKCDQKTIELDGVVLHKCKNGDNIAIGTLEAKTIFNTF
jgi:hypothetical protein